MQSFFKSVTSAITNWCMSVESVKIGDLYSKSSPEKCEIEDDAGVLKFTGSGKTDLLVQTPTGFSAIKQVLKTVPYEVHRVKLEDGKFIECADEHILMNTDNEEIFVKDLTTTHKIQTIDGYSNVASIENTERKQEMFDLELTDDGHVFYTNGILSHNTQCAAGFLLWYAMFKRDQTILIASKGQAHAIEIMDRIRFAYEECPDWLKAGCTMYNRHSIAFDNGSRIISQATTEKTGRGYSISCVTGDTLVTLRNKNTGVIQTVPIKTLMDATSSINTIHID